VTNRRARGELKGRRSGAGSVSKRNCKQSNSKRNQQKIRKNGGGTEYDRIIDRDVNARA
jgi:hypothetical protein